MTARKNINDQSELAHERVLKISDIFI